MRFFDFLLLSLVAGACKASTVDHATAAASQQACQRIAGHLGASIVQSSGAAYDFAASNAWNFANALLRPTCIVFPSQAAHVQAAMREIYRAKSRFAVQAGSHSAMKGWNNVQDGVLIVFSNMKNATYNPASDSIILEPGIHWGEATATLSRFGVAPVGGRVGDVGTGLLLGGGLSFLSPSQGYAADNFKALDVVLVDGRLITATATNQYSDLFRAMKGGANRFGIVTRYEVQAVHVGTDDETPFFGGFIIYDGSTAEALSKATAKYVREVNDPQAVLLTTFTTIVLQGVLQTIAEVFLFYRGTSLPPSIFGDFLAIPALVTQVGPLSYTQVLATIGPESVNAQRGFVQHMGASALAGQEQLYLDALTHYQNFTNTFMNPASGAGMNYSTLAFTAVPASQIAAGRAKGGNVMIPANLKKGFAAVQLAQQFNPGVSAIPSFVQQGIDLLFRQVPPSPGLPLYVNECDAGQKVFESYGGYELLKATYRKYDPERFNVQHCQGPIGL
ncbi:FAD-binding protein [Mycena indigotica]|uniref:FAD-binding protein n=1 Tax=Mycena indigotica TaxID=2126181 RepID=A0A8H6TEM0_9AGAR|nr:FAD-binding protein [Mycena indigotica]KAF7316080.1 FAD-binding protein [Mycena indigotica]